MTIGKDYIIYIIIVVIVAIILLLYFGNIYIKNLIRSEIYTLIKKNKKKISHEVAESNKKTYDMNDIHNDIQTDIESFVDPFQHV